MMNGITASAATDAPEPMVSLVIPVYNVEAFLPDFLDSLAAQTPPLADCEIVFVNDGSTDGSAALIRAWIARTGAAAEVVDQPNQGVAAARNAGLERASGTWVSFPDPDDVLDREYLRRVRAFIAGNTAAVDLVSTHAMILDDESGQVTDTHPLRRIYSRGTRVVDLDRSPDSIHLSAATGLFRRARIEELGLRFDGSIRPTFEDASFTTRYLLASTAPCIGIVADALYVHRRRSDPRSLTHGSWLQADRYTTVLERGYLGLLRRVARDRGSVPVWVQNVILFDLLLCFRADQRTNSATGLAREEWTDRFHELAEEVLGYIDVETIDGFAVTPTSRQLRESLVIGYKGQRRLPGTVRLDKLDVDQRLARLRYFFAGSAPDEGLWLDGRAALPAYAKTRDLTYFNRVLLYERILWLPATVEIGVSINGRQVPLELGDPPSVVVSARPSLIWQRLRRIRQPPPPPMPGQPEGGPSSPVPLAQGISSAIRTRIRAAIRRVRRIQRSVMPARPGTAGTARRTNRTGPFADFDARLDARIVRTASSRRVRKRFAHAWTFIDRDTEAHDNAEHLYRFVSQHHPELNAWFVLRRDAADWDRLASEGFRLVPFGTPDHVQLLLNTEHVVSSQVDPYVVQPLDRERFGRREWRFTFLQHGVTHNDVSRWLNPKPIDRFITASTAEHASVVDDHTPYVFTTKEVRLTGFPRHDRLLELKRNVDRPSLILVMPTWRRWLVTGATVGNARELSGPLEDSAFGRAWFSLVGSPELRAVAETAGLEIAFLPHPILQAHVSADEVPPWVSIHGYDSSDVQDLLARAAVTVTDYSSLAFEAAYLESPVVYYQFDRADFFSGTHVHRKGSWDYEPDGFGPVALTRAEALDAIRDAVARGEPVEPYLSRMRAAFPFRDGRCCERTLESILSLTQPATYEEAFRFVGDPK